jgi:hypothetical protein
LQQWLFEHATLWHVHCLSCLLTFCHQLYSPGAHANLSGVSKISTIGV